MVQMMYSMQGGTTMSTVTTQISNGKHVRTERVVQNGRETVTVTENGVLVSRTIDGVPHALESLPGTQVYKRHWSTVVCLISM